MIILCAVLNGLVSYFISAIFKRFILFSLIFFSTVILNLEILSLIKSINSNSILILTFIEAFISFFIWKKRKAPKFDIKPKEFFTSLKELIIKDKTVLLLLVAFMVLIFRSFLLALLCPPNEPDAQCYHALRCLFWLKDGFIHHFEIADIRNICFPINSELFYTWILALTKNDIGYGILEFASFIVLITSGYKVMELFNINFEKRIWASLIFSSFALVIVQLSSTQSDLCVGALFMLGIYLALFYKKEKNISDLYFCSLSLSLTLGVKSSAFVIIIPIFLWLICIFKKDFIKFFLFFILNFLIFSSYNYILNYMYFGNFISSEGFIYYHRKMSGLKVFISNLIKNLFQFVDFSGLNLGNYLNNYIMNFRNSILTFLNIPLNMGEIDSMSRVNVNMDEQVGGLGILGFLVFLPCVIVGFFNKNTKVFSFFFIASFILLSLAMGYTVYGIRYMLGFISLSYPVLSLSYFKKQNIIKIIIVIYAIFYMVHTSMYSTLRPYSYLKNEVFREKSIKAVQDRIRNLDYKFMAPTLYSEYTAYKKSAQNYCKNGNKIGIISGVSNVLYGAKYLELENDCKIDTIVLLHANKDTLLNYDAIILEEGGYQNTVSTTKEDIKNDTVTSDIIACKKGVIIKGNIPYNYICRVNEKLLSFEGYKKRSEYIYIDKDNDNFVSHKLITRAKI